MPRGFCGSATQRVRCCGVFLSQTREFHGEAVLVTVCCAEQLKQLVELHRVAELAMKDLIIRLWPAEAIPVSYFDLVKRLVNACPRLDAIKRSICIEGARMAFAGVKI